MMRIKLSVSSKLTFASFILKGRKEGRSGGGLPRPTETSKEMWTCDLSLFLLIGQSADGFYSKNLIWGIFRGTWRSSSAIFHEFVVFFLLFFG